MAQTIISNLNDRVGELIRVIGCSVRDVMIFKLSLNEFVDENTF